MLAIAEYNQSHERQKLAAPRSFLQYARQVWHHQIFIHHDFDHPLYNLYVGEVPDKQLKLR